MSAFANLDEFLAMGGHAAYVWPAYGVTLLVILYILCAPLLAQRRFVREERQRLLREGAQREAPRTAHADRETSA
jgi:heme exporter protein D